MKILASIHLYPPKHNCGGEMMAHGIFKYLQNQGHEVRVLLHQANKHRITSTYVYDGIDVFPPNENVIQNLFRWADAVFTHLDYTHWTISMGRMYRKPVFHLIHNSHNYPEIGNCDWTQYIVYNSDWVKQKLEYKFPNFTLTPPVDYREFDLDIKPSENEYITLVNVNENKGGKILVELARAMPNKSFLGVLGSYDEQITQNLPNVRYVSNTTNIKEWYAQTRIVIMPSEYESWGMVATEAMCSGIPVICTEADGLKENCGKAGIYVKDRNDIKSWVSEITRLDDAKVYAWASRKAKERSREHDPEKKLSEFHTWFKEKVQGHKN